MFIQFFTDNDIKIYQLSGKILGGPDSNTLYQNIQEDLDKNIVNFIIDLSDVKWINSSGLGILINIYNIVNQKGGKIILVSNSEQIAKMLKVTRLNTFLKLFPDLESAKKELKN